MDRYATLRHGLVGAWCPSLGATGYTLLDRGPNNLHGTLTNMGGQSNWVADGDGVALNLDGTNDYVDVGTDPRLRLESTPWTISFWAKPQLRSRFQVFVAHDSNVAEWQLYEIGITNSNTCYAFSLYQTGQGLLTGVAMSAGWQHVAVTGRQLNGTQQTVTLYQGGISRNSHTWTLFGSLRGQRLRFGVDAESGSGQQGYLAGLMDDIRIYRRTLDVQEVRLLGSRRGIGLVPTRHRRANVLGSQFWLRQSGEWKKATTWIKVNGVWTKATPKINVSGTWK